MGGVALTGTHRLGRVLPLVLMAMIGVVVWLNAEHHDKPAASVNCPDLAAGCAVEVEGRAVRIGATGGIRPLRPFELSVVAPWAGKVEACFTMEGMDMGFNLYVLRADNEGVFRARVTLPVCVTGSREWLMTLDLDGMRLTVPFVTEL
jgi:hypothetical protein